MKYQDKTTSRSKHLAWCKERANEYVQKNDLMGAFTSFQSDMKKHAETSNHMALEVGIMMMLSGNLATQHQLTEWINGFN